MENEKTERKFQRGEWPKERKAAAEYLGVSLVTVDRHLKRNQIGHFRIGRRVLFSEEHLRNFQKRHEVQVT